MTPTRLLVAGIGLATLLGACNADTSEAADDSTSDAMPQDATASEQTWEPIQKHENALPLRNMPVPDEVLIAEMAAADAARAEQRGGPPVSDQPAATQSPTAADQAPLSRQASAADAALDIEND